MKLGSAWLLNTAMNNGSSIARLEWIICSELEGIKIILNLMFSVIIFHIDIFMRILVSSHPVIASKRSKLACSIYCITINLFSYIVLKMMICWRADWNILLNVNFWFHNKYLFFLPYIYSEVTYPILRIIQSGWPSSLL